MRSIAASFTVVPFIQKQLCLGVVANLIAGLHGFVSGPCPFLLFASRALGRKGQASALPRTGSQSLIARKNSFRPALIIFVV
jgi:hypothetical protein